MAHVVTHQKEDRVAANDPVYTTMNEDIIQVGLPEPILNQPSRQAAIDQLERKAASQRAWRARNPEKARAAVARWVSKNRESLAERRKLKYSANRESAVLRSRLYREMHSKEINERKRKDYQTNRKKRLSANRVWRIKNKSGRLLASAKQRAAGNGIPFDLEIVDIVIPDRCPVLGVTLTHGSKENKDNSPSLDRIIPEKGYVKGNIRVISWRANRIKSDATHEELSLLSQYVKQSLEENSKVSK